MRFTDAAVKALKPQADRYEVWEDGQTGFGVRVSPKGLKSWIFMYRFDGKARRMTLGNYPAMSLRDAGLALAEAKKKLDLGADPGVSLVQSRKDDREALTVKDLVDEYLERWAKPRKRSWQEDERILNLDVVPGWGRRKAKDITRRDVLKLLDGIVGRGAPIQANRTLEVVRRMFNFAIERDIIAVSPCYLVKAPSRENRKDRVLSADEIRALWCGLDRAGDPASDDAKKVKLHPLSALAVKLMLVTCQRKGEVVGVRWEDIDREAEMWTIPAEVAKNGQAHRVPLSKLALDILDAAERLATPKPKKGQTLTPERPPFVFYSARTRAPFTPEAINTALSRNFEALGVKDFTPHDLRRTGASHMTSMGIPRLTVSKVLNHVEKGVTAIYDRYAYDPEKRHALDTWAARLVEIVEGKAPAGNVVALRPAEA